MKKKIALRYTIFLSVAQKLVPAILMVLLFSAQTYSQGNNFRHFKGDSLHVWPGSRPPMHRDTVPPPPPPPHDSFPVFHDSIAPPPPFRHDSFPPPPPPFRRDSFPPPPHDSTAPPSPSRHDSFPPPPHDSIAPPPHDSFPPPPLDSIAPPPPPCTHDSFPPPPHDSIAPPPHHSFPPPPPPHDSTGRKGPREEVNPGSTTTMSAGIYPNPVVSNAVLHIENSANGNISFVLFNISGKMVVSETNLSNGDYSLNRNELGSGLYLYKVYDTNNNIITGKIIIQ